VKSALLSGLLLIVAGVGCAAEEMKPPRLTFAEVDWAAAVATIPANIMQGPLNAGTRLRMTHGGGARNAPPALSRLNNIMAQRFSGLATSPVPVLLPFNTDALLNDHANGADTGDNERYLSGFRSAKFFFPGPAGYDAVFAIRTDDVPELADSKYPDPIEVHVSGSALLYEIDWPVAAEGVPVPSLEAEFPGIRRLILEHRLRYTFVRFGVPYAVTIICFDSGVSRYKMPTCRTAEHVALRLLRALRVVGGMPQQLPGTLPLAAERPAKLSDNFSYHAPGKLLSGTGFRGGKGRADLTVYSQIRFPLADAPAIVNSQMFHSRNRSSRPNISPNYSYPWRDNFCERRGFPVGQCPAGVGHQGEDIRPARCKTVADSDRCARDDDVVAVRGGMILRSRRQEAVYLFVNNANEHIRFRYLHMEPRKMDADNLLSGRRVHEGEVIGQVSNFSIRPNGTSYHLHFDVQVPTKHGWVFVNPYMTLVAAYERLIAERGAVITDPALAGAGDNGTNASVGSAPQVEPADSDAPAAQAPQVELPTAKPTPPKVKKRSRHKHVRKHRLKKKRLQQASQ
jgi:hypothetical protein